MISQIQHLSSFLEGTKNRMFLSYEGEKSIGPRTLNIIYTSYLCKNLLSESGKIIYILYAVIINFVGYVQASQKNNKILNTC